MQRLVLLPPTGLPFEKSVKITRLSSPSIPSIIMPVSQFFHARLLRPMPADGSTKEITTL